MKTAVYDYAQSRQLYACNDCGQVCEHTDDLGFVPSPLWVRDAIAGDIAEYDRLPRVTRCYSCILAPDSGFCPQHAHTK